MHVCRTAAAATSAPRFASAEEVPSAASDIVDGISKEQHQKRTAKKNDRGDGVRVAEDGNGGEIGCDDC
ncbi:unnamed protein product [Linum trigynum]|uniref:Secreted protein n=1 Tax=Linum trigynum TaxID=586398 RepID=A0AAV2DW08_9ROSI